MVLVFLIGGGVAVYVGLVVYYLSTILLTPPHYRHSSVDIGLHKQGPILDPIWGKEIHDPKTDYGLDFKEVEFTSDSKGGKVYTLRGWHIPLQNSLQKRKSKKIGIITVHGGGRDRREFHRFESFITAASYEMLLFDYREHGISEGQGKGMDWGHQSYHDVTGAAIFAKRVLKWDVVICLGVSNGAVLSILAAAHDLTGLIDGIIAESPYMSHGDGIRDLLELAMEKWPIGIRYLSLIHFLIPLVVSAVSLRLGGIKISSTCIAVIDKIKKPVLFIHGTSDNRFRTRNTELLFKRMTHQQKELWLIPGGKHTEGYDTDPKEYQKRVLGFIQKHFESQ